jgi:hypothetical protein
MTARWRRADRFGQSDVRRNRVEHARVGRKRKADRVARTFLEARLEQLDQFGRNLLLHEESRVGRESDSLGDAVMRAARARQHKRRAMRRAHFSIASPNRALLTQTRGQ